MASKSKWGSINPKKVIQMAKANAVHEDQLNDFDIPIRVHLGGNCLVYEDENWVLENSSENQWREKVVELEHKLVETSEETASLKEKIKRTTEESNLVKFKNQLLIEMLAIATLDEEKHADAIDREKYRSNLLEKELRKLLQQALHKGLDIKTSLDLESGQVDLVKENNQ